MWIDSVAVLCEWKPDGKRQIIVIVIDVLTNQLEIIESEKGTSRTLFVTRYTRQLMA